MTPLEDIAYFKTKLLTVKTQKVCLWPFMDTHRIEQRKSAATRYMEMVIRKWHEIVDGYVISYDPEYRKAVDEHSWDIV